MGADFDGLTNVVNLNCTGQANYSNPFVDTAHLKPTLRVPGANALHRYKCSAHQAGSVVSQRITLAIVDGLQATLLRPEARAVVSGCVGAATVTIDFLKNGSSILAGGTPITLNSGAGTTLQLPTLSATSAVQGDVIEANVTATAGGGTLPVGLAVNLTVEEYPNFI